MSWIFKNKETIISKTTDGKFDKEEKTTDMTGEETISSMYDQCCKMTDQEPKKGLSTGEQASACMDMMASGIEKKTEDEGKEKKEKEEVKDEEPKKEEEKKDDASKTKDSYNFDEMKIMIAGMPNGSAKDSMSEAIVVAQGVKKDDNFEDLSKIGKVKDSKPKVTMSDSDFRDLITGKK